MYFALLNLKTWLQACQLTTTMEFTRGRQVFQSLEALYTIPLRLPEPVEGANWGPPLVGRSGARHFHFGDH